MSRRTQYQYEPLVTPESWQGEERRFALRLGMILDALHQRVGWAQSADRLHPVGSVYLSADAAAQPERLFGGAWETLTSPMEGVHAWKRTA